MTRFGTVEYAEGGSGEPLLAIHGFFGGCDEALLSLRGLAAGRRAIAPSRFGYLGSSMPAGATVAGKADAFAALLDGLGIDRLDVAAISSWPPRTRSALLVGGSTAWPVLLAVAWTAGLVVVLAPLAVRRYRRG